ncbi:MAG: hypothetical protein ABUT20_00395 [Bacteroidota bacterium]
MTANRFFKITITTVLLFRITVASAQDTSVIKSLPPVTVKASTRKIPNRIWKGFSTYFNDAENPRWFKVNKNYLVKYMIYDEQNRALFTKKGNLIYHISYGYEKSLPEDLRNLITDSYHDYTITGAIKVTEAGREIWVVNLENNETLVLLRLENGEMEEVQKLLKSS